MHMHMQTNKNKIGLCVNNDFTLMNIKTNLLTVVYTICLYTYNLFIILSTDLNNIMTFIHKLFFINELFLYINI